MDHLNGVAKMSRKKLPFQWFLALLLMAGASGCGQPLDLLQALPGADAVAGWQAKGEPQEYDRETIFQLMDGQAEYFFRYGFELVAIRSFQNSGGNNLDVEVWQLATNADAYGLFSANDDDAPASLGKANEANIGEGDRLVFWQDRYFVLVRSAEPVPDADLLAFGSVTSNLLPTGGTTPEIVKRLPADGKIERSEIFFHEEMTIQNELWLGGENVLGLSPQTNAVLARYDLNEGAAQLLLVEYPDSTGASSALAALDSGGVEEFQAAQAEGNTLAAAFGHGTRSSILRLLDQALTMK
jgi:hypothetical protein